MKRFWIVSLAGLFPLWTYAQRPVTQAGRGRPVTSVSAQRPQTTVEATRPQTSVSVFRPVTGVVDRPQTTVQVSRPVTTVQTNRPQTSASAQYPQTTVEVFHPQNTLETFHPQTPVFEADMAKQSNGPAAQAKAGASSSGPGGTSMSDFKPKPAKDFTQEMPKAPNMGGGSLALGNDTTDQAEKDAIAANHLRTDQQKSLEGADLKEKSDALAGLDKMLTDRTKVQQKKQ